MAAGVASDRAQGQVTISTATATASAREGSTCHQAKPAAAAATSTSTRKGAAMRSASTASRGFSVEACSIRRTIWPKRVSLPRPVMRTCTCPARLKLPATTASPCWRVTG